MSISQRISDAKGQLQSLTEQFKEIQERCGSLTRSIAAQDEKAIRILVDAGLSLKRVRSFNHHSSEVTCVQWSGDNQMFVSAGKDGQVAVWNALTKKKVQQMYVDIKMLMTCAFEKKKNQLVAAGGADKVCSVFTVGQAGIKHAVAELSGHDGYISQCQFVDENSLLTSSGDSTACLWDIRTAMIKTKITDHAADCLSVALHTDCTTVATGSSDCTVKLTDLRSGKVTQTITGHESDVNHVSFFPGDFSEYCIATASTDSTCRIFDIRSGLQLASFENSNNAHNNCSALSVCFSRTGRFLFTSYDDNLVEIWDLLDSSNVETSTHIATSVTYRQPSFSLPREHNGSIMTLDVNPSGEALATASADHTVKVWA